MPSKQKSPDSVICGDKVENHEAELGEDRSVLTLNLSATLKRKLTEKAQIEGVSVQDFAKELLAEGLVLRAWEIVEKKNAMRGVNSSNATASQPTNNYRGQKVGYRSHQNSHVKRMPDSNSKNISRQSYKNIMDDNANFLEYVRNQEKRDRY